MKVDFTLLPMEIDFQTSDHVVTMEKVAEQFISTKCDSFQVISDFTRNERYRKVRK